VEASHTGRFLQSVLAKSQRGILDVMA